ncbi:MAG TPA: SusC/RagA family TonB-linked outer membrane protein [Bacteroides sp.]|nr:SusC/RagA family TonB-linked outer membrane protein [Bacteroides sp.]
MSKRFIRFELTNCLFNHFFFNLKFLPMKRFATLLALFVFVGFNLLQAQSVQITGNVTSSEDGLGLPGVSIVVQGTTLGAVTNLDGDFTMNVPEDANTLVFSFIGMKTREIAIGGRTEIVIIMDPDAIGLDEVVVTAIGITREAKALGYGVQKVDGDDIARSNNANMLNSLSGKVAGVRVTSSSGSAGGSSFIEIRGSSSILGNNQPLFIVDGVPIDNGGGAGGVQGVALSNRAIDLNPEDIESMSVLKGGAATALYGLRAANGAIIITTKKGTAGRTSINLHSSVTIENISQVPELQETFTQGSYAYAEWWEGFYGSQNPIASPADNVPWNTWQWGPKISELSYTTDPNWKAVDDGIHDYVPMDEYMQKWDENGRIVFANDLLANGSRINLYDPYAYFETGVSFNNTLSMSGGNETNTYYFSIGNSRINGIVPNNKFNKTTVKLSADSKLTSKFSTGVNFSYMYNVGDRMQQGSNASGVMLGLLRTPAVFDNSAGYEFPDGTQRNYAGGGVYDNPNWVSNKILYRDDLNRIIGDLHMDYIFTDWLKLKYRLGIDWYTRGVKDHFAINSSEYPAGYVATFREYSRDLNSDLMLNFNEKYGDVRVNVTLGQNMYSSYWNRPLAIGNGLEIPGFYNMANSADVKGYEDNFQKRTAAIFADIGIAYKSLLYFALTGRNEWSTTMPQDANSFFYPSASLGFVFTELPGIQGNMVLPFGKLRASYAIVANDATAYATETYFGPGGSWDGWTNTPLAFPALGYSGFAISSFLGNSDLRPEKMTSLEVGLDLRFLNNRISLDLAYYMNENSDLLLFVPVAPSAGFNDRFTNAGTMTTKGMDILLKISPVVKSNFRWDLIVNFSNPNTHVTDLAPGVENVDIGGGFVDPKIFAIQGESYRSIYGLRYLRDPASNQIIINDRAELDDPNVLGPGVYGYPVMDNDAGKIGEVQPSFNVGMTNTITLKGLTLSALLDVKRGGQMWNGTKGALYYFGAHKDTEDRERAYVHEGLLGHYDIDGNLVHYDANGDEQPGAGAANSVERPDDEYYRWFNGIGSNFTGPSEPYVEDADWVRLRELTVAYNFASLIGDVSWLQNLEIYFTGRNLWVSTPYTGIDPETNLMGSRNAQGFDYFNMPGTKAYSFGLRVGF